MTKQLNWTELPDRKPTVKHRKQKEDHLKRKIEKSLQISLNKKECDANEYDEIQGQWGGQCGIQSNIDKRVTRHKLMELCIYQFMEGFINQVQQFEFYEKLLEMSKQKAHDLFSIFNDCDCYFGSWFQ